MITFLGRIDSIADIDAAIQYQPGDALFADDTGAAYVYDGSIWNPLIFRGPTGWTSSGSTIYINTIEELLKITKGQDYKIETNLLLENGEEIKIKIGSKILLDYLKIKEL